MHTLEGGAWHLSLGLINLSFSCHVTHSDILILLIVKFSCCPFTLYGYWSLSLILEHDKLNSVNRCLEDTFHFSWVNRHPEWSRQEVQLIFI